MWQQHSAEQQIHFKHPNLTQWLRSWHECWVLQKMLILKVFYIEFKQNDVQNQQKTRYVILLYHHSEAEKMRLFPWLWARLPTYIITSWLDNLCLIQDLAHFLTPAFSFLFSINVLLCSSYLFIVSQSLNKTQLLTHNAVLSDVLTSCSLLSWSLRICSHCWPCDSLSRKPKPCSRNSKLLNGLNARIYPFCWHAFW